MKSRSALIRVSAKSYKSILLPLSCGVRCCTTKATTPDELDKKEKADTPDQEGKPTDDKLTASEGDALHPMEKEPTAVRWDVPDPHEDPTNLPIVDQDGNYIVSRVQWPTGEVAYTTPPPVDDKLAPRFGYNVVQVKKHVSWWQYNQKYPRLSFAYLNIQVLFLLGVAWLMAFLTEEYRRSTEALRTPGAMVGEHRGRGPATQKTQKVSFTPEEMNSLVNRAQENWLDAEAEANYIGSKNYRMQKIPRPKEFSPEDFRKR
ncbi:hypothetical protein AGDE_03826 [Angomonas deanei]|nr:hypothetical protein AGDE_03826 [Angomonas deanei]|eukprot:EPY40102.1 hypothetical protein AGDE_03826 [Angomonas deanei]